MTACQRSFGELWGARCAEKAARVSSFDAARAQELVLERLREAGGPVSGEALVDYCIAAGLVPHDARAFGVVFGALAREKKIVSVGFCSRKKGHGTAGARLWQLAPEAP